MRVLSLIALALLALCLNACSDREVGDLKAQVAALRAHVQTLQTENAALRAQLKSNDAARPSAERAAQAFSEEVYQAATAAMAEDPNERADNIAADHPNCLRGVRIAEYGAGAGPAGVRSCTIVASGGDLVVTVRTKTHTYVNGVAR